MAEKGKSKTDVAARAENKNKSKAIVCRNCGNKVEAVMAVSPSGKKRMRRICCGE